MDQGVVVIGVGVVKPSWPFNDSLEIVQSFIEQSGITFPVVSDSAQSFDQWGPAPEASPVPLDIVVDREGVIRYVGREYSGDDLLAAVEAWK
jgi:peroxiredoxin